MVTLRGISTRLRVGAFAVMLAGTGSASTLLAATPAAAHSPAHVCQCVDYIKHVYGLTGAMGNAKDMGPALQSRGFTRLSSPQVGAVVIFQPSFGGVNSTYGHVGIIRAVWQTNYGRNWQVTVRAANQGGWQTISNCKNVNDVTFHSYTKGSAAVAYYKR